MAARRWGIYAPSAPHIWVQSPTTVQLCWGQIPAGPLRLHVDAMSESARALDRTGEIAGRRSVIVEIDHDGGAGGIRVDDLCSDTAYRLDLWAANRRVASLTARTTAAPAGRLLARVATVSDLHLGSRYWGLAKTMVDLSGDRDPAPLRCARGAITEASAWGAQHLVIKGDAAHHQAHTHFSMVGDLVDEFPELPMTLIPGNHEVDDPVQGALPHSVGQRQLRYTDTVQIDDIAAHSGLGHSQADRALRIISVNTAMTDRSEGTLTPHTEAIIDAVADAGRTPCLILLHHQLQRVHLPISYPPGISAQEARPLLRTLAQLDAPVWISSGHTHRNRGRRTAGIECSEVASTRDWPGVWAAYEVYDGGMVQTVYRVNEPSAASWHDYSRWALGGWWSYWSRGRPTARCRQLEWEVPIV